MSVLHLGNTVSVRSELIAGFRVYERDNVLWRDDEPRVEGFVEDFEIFLKTGGRIVIQITPDSEMSTAQVVREVRQAMDEVSPLVSRTVDYESD